MIKPSPPFHSINTAELVDLTYGLDVFLDGGLERGAVEFEELLPAGVLARAQAEIGHLELPDLLVEAAFELSRRHPETIGASLAAWHSWNHRTGMSWGEALHDGADYAAEGAA